ncbi:MAG: amidase [Armatimonadota bacterium]|nr:amidase [Armatimonadota bacterium]MDR7484724.1 amidase [Armatimonadota bacterium]MDR7531839.1 amidase [Armatimonadota bacterium]MDR7534816.1 amidase [Armatimonadota bacterium]
MNCDLCFVPAVTLARLYRARQVSPFEVMEAVLAQVDAVNPRINAVVTLAREQALEAARAATRRQRRGAALSPLFGIPVTIKDLTPTAGLRTTWGSKVFEHHVPEEDALVVQRLKAAGAIVLGKTNTPEFGAGGNTFNPVFGPTRNPWDLARTAGGSSGGAAAALAAGLGPLAQGSDLGGSLRVPAAFCGVVGFRTTAGLVPVYPSEFAWDTLAVAGPMARTVADVALMLSVIAGPDDRAPLSCEVDTAAFLRAVRAPSVRGWRVAWTPDLGGLLPVHAEVAAAVEGAAGVFRRLGARVTAAAPAVTLDEVDEIMLGTRGPFMVGLHADRLDRWRHVMTPHLVWNIEQGLALSPRAIARAEQRRTALWHRTRGFMEAYDLLLLPTTPIPPFPVEQPYPTELGGQPMRHYLHWLYLTYAITLTGLPAISVPCGLTRAGLPVGLQIVGRRRAEAAVLRAAAAYERAAPWAHLIPPAARPAVAPGARGEPVALRRRGP